jgi:hypothetical protein
MRKLFLIAPIVGLVAAGCASASAKGKSADAPALNVPPPPPRMIEPAPEPPPEPVGEMPTPPSSTPAARPGRPASREVPPKPEAPPAPTPKADEPPASPPAPNAQLRTPQTSDMNAANAVRATIERAKNTLSTVNYGPLSNERKKAYNDSKQFIVQAEDALKQGNIVFAQAVAAKAETLAREIK